MKKLLGLVVIVAALVLGGYYGMGLITERTLKNNIAIINHSNGLFVDVAEYNRSWFKSTAVLNWRINIPEHLAKSANGTVAMVPAQDYKVQMPLTIYHGPVIASPAGVKFGLGYAHSDVVMPAMYTAKFSNLFTSESTQPKLIFSILVNYLNTSALQLNVPSFKLISKQDGGLFEWDGMEDDLHVTSNLKNIDGNINVAGIRITKNKIKATISKIKSAFDLHQTEAGMYLGELSFSLPSLILQENTQKIFEIEQFNIHSNSDVQNALFEQYVKVFFDKFTSKSQTYGPALLEISIKNIDATVLARLNAQANQMQQGSDLDRQRSLLTMLPELPALFSKGAQFEISKLSVVVPDGVVEGDLSISLPKGNAGNPFKLLQKVQGHGKLKLPEGMVKHVVMILAKQALLSQPNAQKPASVTQSVESPGTPGTPGAIESAGTSGTPSETSTPALQPSVVSDKLNTTGVEKAQVPSLDKTKEAAASSEPEVIATGQITSNQSAPLTDAEFQQRATVETEQKLSALLKSGILSLQGSEYVIELNLQQGQLLVNGKPFNSAMLQF